MQSALSYGSGRRNAQSTAAFALLEVVIAAFALGVVLLALFASLSSGFSIIQSARENLRATQILVQRTEAIRLYNWTQILDTNYLKPTFIEYYDPQSSSNSVGTRYTGFVTASRDLPSDDQRPSISR